MRICLTLAEGRLRSALEELLREQGHEVLQTGGKHCTCDLRILPEPIDEAERPEMTTLYLRPAAYQQADADAAAALRDALQQRGTAVWNSPLDARLLLSVLAEHERGSLRAVTEESVVPDLGSAPHPWMVIDVNRRTVVQWSPKARDLFQYPPAVPPGGLPLEEASMPGRLRDALLGTSDGRMPLDSLGSPHIAAWWTGQAGRRVLCLLEDPGGRTAPADRHLRTLAEIGRMAATLAHEIRNPVASVAGALDLIAELDDPKEREEIVGMARARLEDMRTLLDDTLRMARPLDQEVETIELQVLIQSACASVAIAPVFAEVEIEVDVPDEPVRILAHVGPLQQALVNLLMNAAQAQGGVGRVTLSAGVEGRSGMLRVVDEGPGIPEDLRERVFQPFYTTKTGGTGLGLAFVRRVVEAAGGSVWVEPGDEGTSICVHLPLEG
ncbi:MAG: HAMP domain-containing sensor histidine kinase [Planctomycetota bacterium]|nr:HAMP domain-containing sensor histidine kinase [Planctomycetota bacterium]